MKNKQLKNIFVILIITVTTLTAASWFFTPVDLFNIRGYVNKHNCEEEYKIKYTLIKGVVTKKFQDERKNNYFNYAYKGDTMVSDNALLKNDFFNKLEIGDTIQKDKGSLIFHIFRNGRDIKYLVDFDCN